MSDSKYQIHRIGTTKLGAIVELKKMEEVAVRPKLTYFDKNNNLKLDKGDLVMSDDMYRTLYQDRCRKGTSPVADMHGSTSGCMRRVTMKDVLEYRKKINAVFKGKRYRWTLGQGSIGSSYPKFIDVNRNGRLDPVDMIIERSDRQTVCPSGKKWVPHHETGRCVRSVSKKDIAQHGPLVGALFALGMYDRSLTGALMENLYPHMLQTGVPKISLIIDSSLRAVLSKKWGYKMVGWNLLSGPIKSFEMRDLKDRIAIMHKVGHIPFTHLL